MNKNLKMLIFVVFVILIFFGIGFTSIIITEKQNPPFGIKWMIIPLIVALYYLMFNYKSTS